MPTVFKKILQNTLIVCITIALSGVLGEVLLRVKNSSQQNYVVEMWRYARELKKISQDPDLGHLHIPNSNATLQNVIVAINSLGMRGPEPNLSDNAPKKVLLLGSSITLGWGVQEKDTIRNQLEQNLGGQYQVLNGGIGNYNLARSVAQFRKSWRNSVKPDVVVVHYFVNDAEYLGSSADNFIFRNSQLAVTLYHVVQGLAHGSGDMKSLTTHYQSVYAPNSRGFSEMESALNDLVAIGKRDNFRIILAMIPDVHQLQDYPFSFIHKKMKYLAVKYKIGYLDFFDSLRDYQGPELWTIPGDPHPNAQVHAIMAKQLAQFLK
jgi:hypothetical protein